MIRGGFIVPDSGTMRAIDNRPYDVCANFKAYAKSDRDSFPVTLFYSIQLFLVDLFKVLPVLFIQLGEHPSHLLAEFIAAFDGLDGRSHNLFLPGALLEGFALAGAEPHFIDAEFPADVRNCAVTGLSYSRA